MCNSRLVIWGVSNPIHSHHYIHKGFYETAKQLGSSVIWLPDKLESVQYIESSDLVIAVNVSANYLPIREDVFYVLHNFPTSIVEACNCINLQVLTADTLEILDKSAIKLRGNAWFDEKSKTLVQSWGCPRNYDKFLKPIDNRNNKFELFVGSVWDNALNQGNKTMIDDYKRYLTAFSKSLLNSRYVPEAVMNMSVRSSPVGAAFVGPWQEKHGYIPCRLFKAISLGKIGLINSQFTNKILNLKLPSCDLRELLEWYFSLDNRLYLEIAYEHQNLIRYETYETKLENIVDSVSRHLCK